MKRIFIIGLAVLLCGCSQNSTSDTGGEVTITDTNSSNKEAYTLIHDGIESLDTLDSYSYTITSLYYVPTIDASIQIKTDQYKIKNEDTGYSGASLSDSYYYTLKFSEKKYETISSSLFENSDTNQKITNEIENGQACSNACTTSLSRDNTSHSSLLSPKENLYEAILGEKTGFLKNVYLKTYEESAQLKETYKTKNNYLQSYIDEKQSTWQDLTIETSNNKKIVSYSVTINLGIDYLNNILNNLEDEDSIEYVQNQIDGNQTYVEKIVRKDQITIDTDGYIASRKQTYNIYCSNNTSKVLTFNDKIDTSKVTEFNFDDVISKYESDDSLQLAGTYVYTDDSGNKRYLIFNSQSVTIEEGSSTFTGTYTIKGSSLKINITDDQGNLESTESYTITDDGTLKDSKGNIYYYYSYSEEDTSETIEEEVISEPSVPDESTPVETESDDTNVIEENKNGESE